MILFVILAAATTVAAGEAYGHGGGFDVAPPIDFDGKNVTVSTEMNPVDMTVGEVDQANMKIRFFDADDDENLKKVTYRVEVWRNEDLLARHLFFDEDGMLDVKIRPVLDCGEAELWKCTRYYGVEHPIIKDALYDLGGIPVIAGPIFDKGGLYNIRVDIEGATSERTLVTNALRYETFVSIAQEQFFDIQTADAVIPMVIKTYYDDVSNVRYNMTDESITFNMPFDWSPDYIENVALVHEEMQFPKAFESYSEDRQYKGYVNGIEVDQRVLVLDRFSDADKNIFHFTVSGSELERINGILGEENERSGLMNFKIVPQEKAVRQTTGFYLVDINTLKPIGTTVDITWDSRYGAGDSIPFEITFFDQDNNLLRDVRYAFFLMDSNDETILEGGTDVSDSMDVGIVALEGIDIQKMTLPHAGMYRLDVRILGTGADYDQRYAGIGSALIEIGESSNVESTEDESVNIPTWIATSAGFWVDDFTSDEEFIGAIKYLIESNVIIIPSTEVTGSSEGIPSWLKISVGFWVDGDVSDDEFVAALQFLIREGVIRIE